MDATNLQGQTKIVCNIEKLLAFKDLAALLSTTD
jgi:hypothetical protein